MDGWCVLRTAPASTLRLATSLSEAGFETWAPCETVNKRTRRGRRPEPTQVPLLPSFVFARANRLQDLLALSHSPSMLYQTWDAEQRKMVTKGHPYFRLFRPAGECGLVSDRSLDPLRSMERRRQPKGKAPAFAVGDCVKLADGFIAGLIGRVWAVKNKRAVFVLFPDWAPIEVEVWKLLPALDAESAVHVQDGPSEQAQSARAA